MSVEKFDYIIKQREVFAAEAEKGTYGFSHFHSSKSRRFFLQILEHSLAGLWKTKETMRVLECGVGDGAWLETIMQERIWAPNEIAGFDLTPELVEISRERFRRMPKSQNSVVFLKTGDITDDNAYYLSQKSTAKKFNLVFCYDVIQQLPDALRLIAVQRMVNWMADNGCAIVFDKHRWTIANLKMGIKKFITKFTGVKLVPKFYLQAHYPNMKQLAQLAEKKLNCRTLLIPDEKNKHFALILKKH